MNSTGRPPKLTPDEVVELFREYSKETKEVHKYVGVVTKGGIVDLPKERPLTIVGFCRFANIGKSTFYGYKDREEFSDIYTHVREAVEADQIEGAMLEIYNPSITARILGLADKQDVTTAGKPIKSTPTPIIAYYQGEEIILRPEDLDGRE